MKLPFALKREKSSALAKRYQTELRRYLKQGPSSGLLPAARLGVQAVALGLETFGLVVFHERALIAQVL
jgi:hypothetical protein